MICSQMAAIFNLYNVLLPIDICIYFCYYEVVNDAESDFQKVSKQFSLRKLHNFVKGNVYTFLVFIKTKNRQCPNY